MYYSSEKKASGLEKFWLFIRMILAMAAIVAVFYFGIKYLQNYEGNQIVLTLIAIVWGVGSVALFYFLANWIVERFSRKWGSRIQPYIFVGPAVLILVWALLIPTVRTFILSMKDLLLSFSAELFHKVQFVFHRRRCRPSEIIPCTDGTLYLDQRKGFSFLCRL